MNARLQTTQAEPFVATAQHSLGQIAVALPGATAIFRRLKLDFCCGGQVSLADAAEAKGLDGAALLAELGALQRPEQPLVQNDPAALIDFILERYHAVHRAQLPELIRMARRVEAVHREHPDVPAGLADVLEAAQEDLLAHMQKEEAILFPLLKAGGNPFVGQPIAMMRAEHTQHGAMLERLLALTHNATPPQGACNTWRALYAGIAQLHDDLISHIHTENNILFAAFDAPAKPSIAAPAVATPAPAAAQPSPCCGACGG
jgi:regulator of cell morphogenesis and NO signaling